MRLNFVLAIWPRPCYRVATTDFHMKKFLSRQSELCWTWRMWWSQSKWPFHLSERYITTSGPKMARCLTTFCCFYYRPGHVHINVHWYKPSSTPKCEWGSDGQCRTVHDGFKPQSPCFLYGVNKSYACAGLGELRLFHSLGPPMARRGSNAMWWVAAFHEGVKVSFQVETSS